MAGNTFKRGVKAPLPPGAVISSPLGDTTGARLAQNDVGKAVKFQNGTGNVAGTLEAILCSINDNIEGFVSSINPDTVNEGYSFGGVQVLGQFEVEVGVSAVAVGDLIELGSQAAIGVVGVPQVIKKTDFTIRTDTLVNQAADTQAALILSKTQTDWVCTQILTGNGTAQGDKILIERVV